MSTFPDWLERIDRRAIDAVAEGKVAAERTGTAVLDGQNGIPSLVLARAGELAIEKARDAGVGLVRVINVGSSGPAASVAAEMAVGPFVGLLIGPESVWSAAFPSEEGLPAISDSALGGAEAGVLDRVAPWGNVLAPDGGWLVAAISVVALEPLGSFQNRVSTALSHPEHASSPAMLSPQVLEANRREAREHGIALSVETWAKLRPWAERFGIAPPEPVPAGV